MLDTAQSIAVQIAGWVRSAVLDDGTVPHGIVYRSRHAGGDVHARALERHYRVEPLVTTHEGEPLILPWRRLTPR